MNPSSHRPGAASRAGAHRAAARDPAAADGAYRPAPWPLACKHARWALPGAAVATMDGWAVRSADSLATDASAVRLRISGESAAGPPPHRRSSRPVRAC